VPCINQGSAAVGGAPEVRKFRPWKVNPVTKAVELNEDEEKLTLDEDEDSDDEDDEDSELDEDEVDTYLNIGSLTYPLTI
jgi:hypothetical protein